MVHGRCEQLYTLDDLNLIDFDEERIGTLNDNLFVSANWLNRTEPSAQVCIDMLCFGR
jgi:hypothetical protein